MGFLRTIFLSAILALASLTSAQSNEPFEVQRDNARPNGCGPKGLDFLVPNKTPITKCEFESACDSHDICYSACLPGQPLHGRSECDNAIMTEKRRNNCDREFYVNIVRNNTQRYVCRAYANLYYHAVSFKGSNWFYGDGDEELSQNIVSEKQAYKEFERIYRTLDQLVQKGNSNKIDLLFVVKDGALIGSIDQSN